jgi:ectoine hydroxylase-related dioxygenase (phytanoyl-CoA dioxygenase family)
MPDLDELVQRFHTNGYLILPDVLSHEEVEQLRQGVERAFTEPGDGYSSIVRVKMFERGPEFEALIDHPNTIDLIEAILGPDCHLIAQNALLTSYEQGISRWHADETVRFPIPLGVKLDPRIQMHCFIVNMNYYLCDVDEEVGPTQFVPGSHRAGRQPGTEDMDGDGNPTYDGRGAVSATGKAGTAVMWHDQTWHRGAPNRSTTCKRVVQQGAYGRRFIAQRFYPFVNYHMPEEILERANPRRKRLLGVHPRGAYG